MRMCSLPGGISRRNDFLSILVLAFNHHVCSPAQLVRSFTLFDLLDKPWSQVPPLPVFPARYLPSFLSRIRVTIPNFQFFFAVAIKHVAYQSQREKSLFSFYCGVFFLLFASLFPGFLLFVVVFRRNARRHTQRQPQRETQPPRWEQQSGELSSGRPFCKECREM